MCSSDLSFGGSFKKIAETTLPTANKLVGHWIETKGFSQDDDLLLLPDGRYHETNYYNIAGNTSSSNIDGAYKITGDKITFDPICQGPITRKFQQVQNHLLLSFTSSLDQKEITSTYMASPATAIEYQLGKSKERDELEAKQNALWKQKIALGPVNTRLGRIPPSGEISADPNPNEVFAKATVFAERELYPFESDYFYFYDLNGNFRSTTRSEMILNPNISSSINLSRGEYHDKQNRYFFQNGRTLTYGETYLNAKSITYPPQPNTQFYWDRYRIEGDKIIIGSGKPLVYEILNGRRQIRLGEQCFENLKYSTANLPK